MLLQVFVYVYTPDSGSAGEDHRQLLRGIHKAQCRQFVECLNEGSRSRFDMLLSLRSWPTVTFKRPRRPSLTQLEALRPTSSSDRWHRTKDSTTKLDAQHEGEDDELVTSRGFRRSWTKVSKDTSVKVLGKAKSKGKVIKVSAPRLVTRPVAALTVPGAGAQLVSVPAVATQILPVAPVLAKAAFPAVSTNLVTSPGVVAQAAVPTSSTIAAGNVVNGAGTSVPAGAVPAL
ncbi:hypothetical protein PYCC9005_001240 [Savitreella phatthalungensis]